MEAFINWGTFMTGLAFGLVLGVAIEEYVFWRLRVKIKKNKTWDQLSIS